MNINWEASYANICRGCMTDEGELHHIYDNKDYFNANIHGKLTEVTGIEVRLLKIKINFFNAKKYPKFFFFLD